jgi:hypothetical protein
MKPDTSQAMRLLIDQIREALPLHLIAEDICRDECKNCSIKLIEYISSEIDGWEYRLQQDEVPNFGDLEKLANSGKKIHRALEKNGLIPVNEEATT